MLGVALLLPALRTGVTCVLAGVLGVPSVLATRLARVPRVMAVVAAVVPPFHALGLRVRRGCSFHGLALNVDMDLEPFSRINPCGYQGLEVTQLSDLVDVPDLGRVEARLLSHLKQQLL